MAVVSAQSIPVSHNTGGIACAYQSLEMAYPAKLRGNARNLKTYMVGLSFSALV